MSYPRPTLYLVRLDAGTHTAGWPGDLYLSSAGTFAERDGWRTLWFVDEADAVAVALSMDRTDVVVEAAVVPWRFTGMIAGPDDAILVMRKRAILTTRVRGQYE